jgi:hypothetical protein
VNDYYIRVKASDRDEMRRVLRAINVMRLQNGELVPKHEGDAWYEVGRICDWQNPVDWLREPVSGEAYWHYNLRTDINVRKRVKDLVALGDPDAIILDSEKGRWFSKLNGDGDDDTPSMPRNVWL